MTVFVVPRKRGPSKHRAGGVYWMPAFAGMTVRGVSRAAIIAIAYFRMVPKLKPFTRCFWISMPRITTGMVIMVPIAA